MGKTELYREIAVPREKSSVIKFRLHMHKKCLPCSMNLTNYGYTGCTYVYVANYLMEIESKHYTVFITINALYGIDYSCRKSL